VAFASRRFAALRPDRVKVVARQGYRVLASRRAISRLYDPRSGSGRILLAGRAHPNKHVKADAISIVEAAYDCESETRGWYRRLLEQAAPKLDRGFGVCVSMYAPQIRPEEYLLETQGMSKAVLDAQNAMIGAYAHIFHQAHSLSAPSLAPHGTSSGSMGLTVEHAKSWTPFVEYLHPLGIHECVGVLARDPSGHVIVFSAPAPDTRRPTRREVAAWSRIAAHISAGARLRRAFPRSGDLSAGADAVLSPSGSVTHAEVAAQSLSARESLRHAAKAIDRARSKARSNDDEALDLWQGLVAGRWSLFDRFDTDGRRFLIARKNDPDVTDPRALTLRERQVLAYSAMGHPLKLIAYSLGITTSTIGASRKLAMRKLGLRTHADIVRLFAAAPGPEPPAQDR
jgi:DNA-binding CsgD family transcriptional regulator